MGVLGARMLADVVARTPTIKIVQLWGNDLGDRGAEAVADLAISGAGLEGDDNDRDDDDSDADPGGGRGKGGVLTGLESLSLEYNDIRVMGAEAIAKALGAEPSPRLKALYLGANAIGADGAVAIVRKEPCFLVCLESGGFFCSCFCFLFFPFLLLPSLFFYCLLLFIWKESRGLL